tara:strand:+ start:1108 stop:1815 length:708 start_codon:yes stop_codon:yes gene_type:complete
MKTIAIIQARMGSTRLPGKVMMKIIGKPIIEHLIDRVSKSGYINDIVVATSNKTENQELINFLKLKGIKIFIGDEEDVLSRYYLTAKKYQAKNIVRITADCPLIDYSVIDSTIKAYFKDTVDYTSNIFPRSFPKGLDTEVFSFKSLEKAFKESNKKYDREHVTPYIRESGKFKISNFSYKKDLSHVRLTVDWKEDFILIDKIFNIFKPNTLFNWLDIISIMDKDPNLYKINSHLV